MRKKIFIIITILGIVILLASAGYTVSYVRDTVITDTANEFAATLTCKPNIYDLTDKSGIFPEDEMDIKAMQEINPDTVGFLKVQDKELPVVCSNEDGKYMKRSWDGKRSGGGTIFMDNYCGLDGKNLILYGHHMKSGRMFGTLGKYLSKDYHNENPYFKWITEDYVDTYEVAAVIKISAEDVTKLLDMDLKSDLDELSEKAKTTGSLYKELLAGKSYMSLVTCEYTHSNGRLIVIGERMKHLERQKAS